MVEVVDMITIGCNANCVVNLAIWSIGATTYLMLTLQGLLILPLARTITSTNWEDADFDHSCYATKPASSQTPMAFPPPTYFPSPYSHQPALYPLPVYPYMFQSLPPVAYSPTLFMYHPSVSTPQLSVQPPDPSVAPAQLVQTDASWYPDSGATNHLTNASPVSSMTTTYTGPGKVLVGNGTALRMSTIGNLVIPTQSRTLNLQNMLHIPCVTNNVLFVSQFAKDNQVYVEFHDSYCLMKDSMSHRVLLRGFESNGLYKLSLSGFSPNSGVSQYASSIYVPALHLVSLLFVVD